MAASADQPQNRHNHLYLQYVTPIPAERGLLTLASILGILDDQAEASEGTDDSDWGEIT